MKIVNPLKGLFKRKHPDNNVEFLSMHIPKTAGITFREILYRVYGNEHVLAINRGELRKMDKSLPNLLQAQHRVIHGHLHYKELIPVRQKAQNLVTWFREPISRVISNYYYNITHEYPKRKQENPNLEMLSLEEFIEKPNRINVMSQFMDGLELEEVFFLGFQEQFVEDLKHLATMLDWPQEAVDETLRLNDNREVKQERGPVPDSVKARIMELNKKDIELYESAKALKESGYWRN
jgi:hypothetical protein